MKSYTDFTDRTSDYILPVYQEKPRELKNYAPVKPLQNYGKGKAPDSYLCQFLKEIHLDISRRDIEIRKQIAEIGQLVAALRAGKEFFVHDPILNRYTLIKQTSQRVNNHRRFVTPLAQLNSATITSIWVSSRPKITVQSFGNSARAQIQQGLIEQVVDYYFSQYIDDLFEQNESLSLMDYGTVLIYPYYHKHLRQLKYLTPIIKNKRKTVFAGYAFCFECGFEGRPYKFTKRMPEQCPECGSYNVQIATPDIIAEVPEVEKLREHTQGDICLQLRNVPACNWDIRGFWQDSSYTQYVCEVPLKYVQTALDTEVASEMQFSEPSENFGLEIVNEIGKRGGSVRHLGRENITFRSSGTPKEVTYMLETHITPAFYAGVKLPKDEKTVCGEVIPKDTPLEKIFPDGILYVGFNDYSLIAGIYNEKRYGVSSVYHLQSHSGYGKGVSDVIEVVEELNHAHTAALEQLKRFGAGGGIWFDERVLTKAQAQALLKPNGLVAVRNLDRAGYQSVEQAIGQLRHPELNQSTMLMIAQLTNLLNISFMTTDFTSGVANEQVNVNTARGQELLHNIMQQRTVAPLRLKGWSRARLAEQVICLFRDYIRVPKYFKHSDKFSLTKGRYVSGADLPEKVYFTFVYDTELPRNSYFQREAVKTMAREITNLGGSFLQLAEAKPRLVAWWAAKFGVHDLPLLNQNEILMVCLDRLNDIAEKARDTELISALAEFNLNSPEDTAVLSSMILDNLRRPVSVFEESHQLKAEVLTEMMDDDTAVEWTPLTRQTVEALIELHYKYAVESQYISARYQQQAQLNLQAEAQAFQAGQASQQQAEAANQMLQQELLRRMGDEYQNEMQQDRDLEKMMLQAELQRQQQLQQQTTSGQEPQTEDRPVEAGFGEQIAPRPNLTPTGLRMIARRE